MRNRGLVDASSRVNIHCVDNFISGLGVLVRLVLILVLARWCQQEAAVRRERESAKEGRECFVCVEARILHSEPEERRGRVRLGRRFHGHHSGQGQ